MTTKQLFYSFLVVVAIDVFGGTFHSLFSDIDMEWRVYLICQSVTNLSFVIFIHLLARAYHKNFENWYSAALAISTYGYIAFAANSVIKEVFFDGSKMNKLEYVGLLAMWTTLLLVMRFWKPRKKETTL